jgi:hypothetical protein
MEFRRAENEIVDRLNTDKDYVEFLASTLGIEKT